MRPAANPKLIATVFEPQLSLAGVGAESPQILGRRHEMLGDYRAGARLRSSSQFSLTETSV